MNPEDRARLPETFEKFWADIRGSQLYAGQPRNAQSIDGVALATEALRLATVSEDPELLVQAWRMLAYSLTANEQYQEAIPYYEKVIPSLEEGGNPGLGARVRIGYVSALTQSGRYEDALNAAGVAERWLKENGDDATYARLCNNIASLYQRLDRYRESHACYETVARVFEAAGDTQALAQVYQNMGYTLARMDRFEEAETMYAHAEGMASEMKIEELRAQASYNHAYFYFLRGRYSEALQSFAGLRSRFGEHGSHRHVALCDLDEAEMYLQLNLPSDAATLSQRAIGQFKRIGMFYEEAKAKAFYGVALQQMGRLGEALETFRDSQEGFARENNGYWVAVLDVYRAEVHLGLARYWEAHSLAVRAKQRFEVLAIPSRRMLSLVLLGRIGLALGDLQAAESAAEEVSSLSSEARVPLLRFPFYMLCGQIAERKQDWAAAAREYSLAVEDLEAHQSRLQYDDLRVTFLHGRHHAYESLVRLSLQDNSDPVRSAYMWCERAKSRSLVELLAHHLPSMQPRGGQSLLKRVHRLREELNLQYLASKPESRPASSSENFDTMLVKEQELARTLREVAPDNPEYVSLQIVVAAGLDTVQGFLPERTTLVEYFSTQEEIIAFVISRNDAKVFRRLAPPSRVQVLQERLSFQLEKFLLGPDYVNAHTDQILEATNHYLGALYDILVKPLISEIRTPHLTIVPHGLLHSLPFHALFDGRDYLIDRFEISYTPSASVLRYCLEKPEVTGTPLILGVADELAPMVDQEVEALCNVFPEARRLSGEAATRSAFADAAQAASFVHVATHATFRQDNPMFSSFKLSDGYLTALDLFSMNCQTNLVTMSSCKSGLSEVSGGDDLLGLMRGFLYAGARSLLLSLWSVSDESTVALMTEFYKQWQGGSNKAKSLQTAMKTVRAAYPNPFFWAPFILVGKV